MAHIKKSGRGWAVVYHEGTGRGAQRHVTPSYEFKADAIAHCARLNEAKAATKPVTPGALLPWSQLVQRWVSAREARGQYGGRYAARARRELTALATAHSWKTTADVKPAQVEGLRIGQRRAALAVLRFASRLDQPIDPRALATEPPRRPRRAKPPLLTDLQVGALLANAALLGGPSAAAYAHLLATYGHRPESLAKLTVAALRGDFLALPVKGGDDIRHPLLPESLALLRPLVEGRPPAAPLFLDHHGKPWGTGQRFADWWWKKVAPILNEPTLRGVYHLKRYAITRMLGLGLDVATIASLTGHRTPSVILTYARTNEQRQANALAALAGAPREHQDKS